MKFLKIKLISENSPSIALKLIFIAIVSDLVSSMSRMQENCMKEQTEDELNKESKIECYSPQTMSKNFEVFCECFFITWADHVGGQKFFLKASL